MTVICLAVFLGPANAQEYTISDYDFSWHVAKAGDIALDVQKDPRGVSIVLAAPGGGLARLAMTPEQAVAVADVLKKTREFYDVQMKKKDPNMENQVSAGDHTVTFSSSRGRNFEVSIRKSVVGALVAMDMDQALKMATTMKDSEKLIQLVNERIKP
jgi:hypothetical protein